MTAASNTLLTPDQITREAIRILHEKCVFARSINREYDSSFAQTGAKIGSTLRIRKPVKYLVSDGATMVKQDTTETSLSLPVTSRKHVGMGFTTNDLSMNIDDFSARFIDPAMSALAATVDADLISQATKATFNQVGTVGTVPNTLKMYLQARAKLNQYLAPKDGRTQILSSVQSAEIVDALKGLFNDTTQVGNQYKEGMMGRTAGADWIETESIHTHTNGTQTMVGTVGTTVSTDGTTTLVAAGMGASKTIKAGTVFTVAGVYAVHPETKVVRNGILQQFVVVSDATSDGSGAASLTVSPAMYYGSTAMQNISAAPTSTAVLTCVGTASTGYEQALLFQKNAFTFATADLVLPNGVDMASRQNYDGFSLRMIRDYNITDDEIGCRIDILYGFAPLYAEHACRITS